MVERPIIFSGEMVRAILEGRKTITRRVVTPQPVSLGASRVDRFEYYDDGVWLPTSQSGKSGIFHPSQYRCPYGTEGNLLWVREKWAQDADGEIFYAADHETKPSTVEKWKPSIHMPRCVSRILLKLTGVRVEWVQNITAEGALAEGVPSNPGYEVELFESLWDSTYEKRGFAWSANPWVWVIKFMWRT